MKSLTKSDLQTFQEAILKDYGITLEGKELHDAAFTLLQFIEALVHFDTEDKHKKVRKSSL